MGSSYLKPKRLREDEDIVYSTWRHVAKEARLTKGDELNVCLILDEDTDRKLERLAPHHSTMSLARPGAISTNLTIPPPVIATINNWMSE